MKKKFLEVTYSEKDKPFTNYPFILAKYLVSRFNLKEGGTLLDTGTGRAEMLNAFTKLGLRKINADVYENNLGSLRAFQKAGFQEEGRRKRQYLSEGKWLDAVCFSINKENYKENSEKKSNAGEIN